MNLRKYHSLILDCDGVILDSNVIKTQAFYELALPYGAEAAQQLVDYHKQHGGVSRFRKLEYFFSTILQRTDFEKDVKTSAEKYGELVKGKLMTCDLIPGFLNFIKQPVIPQVNKIVITGGFQAEVREVFEHRKLSGYFSGIFGSPDTKYEILERELKKNTIALPAAYFGDSKLDHEVAAAFGMDFIFFSAHSEFSGWQDYFTGCNVRIVSDWTDMLFDGSKMELKK